MTLYHWQNTNRQKSFAKRLRRRRTKVYFGGRLWRAL